MNKTRLLLYLRTLRHLRLGQIGRQIARRVYRPPLLKIEVAAVSRRDLGTRSWRTPEARRQQPLPPLSFRFLNLRKDFDPARFDWACPEMSRLWRYNLHYFDYLHEPERSRDSICFVLSNWIRQNPPATPDAWDPFPLSLRIVNWIKLFLRPEWRRQAEASWLKSLYLQSRQLERNLEYHLLGNHLFKNGKALIFAGLFFEGRDAGRWLRKGLELIRRQLEEQILLDGGHFERSPMYHAMILEDCLDLLNLCQGEEARELVAFCSHLQTQAGKMLAFAHGMAHPDGDIALFNDAALGIEATPAELARYYATLTGGRFAPNPLAVQAFPQTGYFVMTPAPGNRMLIDAGPIGPDYQPGHAHCDTLSFELSLGGRRLIVDSGCCHYQDDEIRRYNRGNKGHNVVTLDGVDQSEVWGAHRVARRARPLRVEFAEGDGRLVFEGGHDGYQRLAGKPLHYRRIEWDGAGYLIEDRLTGGGEHRLESRFHIHPDFAVEALSGGGMMVRDRDKPFAEILCLTGDEPTLEEGWYCPEFGKKLNCPVIVLRRKTFFPLQLRWRIRRL